MNFDGYKPLHREKDSAEYQRVHKWVYTNFGKADCCSNNKSHKSSRYHWANISGEYKLEASDWKKMCPTCHKEHDGISDEFRELKRKQSTGNTSHCVPIIRIGGSGLKRYKSAREASKDVGVVFTAISNCLTGRSKSAAGYKWQYEKGGVS